MKHLLLLLMVLAATVNVPAQKMRQKNDTCTFLTDIKYTRGKATIKVTAVYRSVFLNPDFAAVKRAAAKKKLRFNNYFRANNPCCGYSGSAIDFIPVNCSTRFSGPIRSTINFEPFKPGDTVYLACTVYQNETDINKKQLFTVDKISVKHTNLSK